MATGATGPSQVGVSGTNKKAPSSPRPDPNLENGKLKDKLATDITAETRKAPLGQRPSIMGVDGRLSLSERLAALRNSVSAPPPSIGQLGSFRDAISGTSVAGAEDGAKALAHKKGKKGNIFVDAEEMRKRARANLDQKEYNVFELYHGNHHWAAKVAKSDWFNNLTLLLISLNAIWIGAETDYNEAETLSESDAGWQAGEHLFCIFFVTELLIRFFAFEDKRNCLYDGWFRFDFLLVAFMVLETWIISSSNIGNVVVLRLFRLLRVTRMARLMRSLPELMTIFKGMASSTRSVLTVLALLLLFTYSFSIVFKVLGADDDQLEDYFSSIPLSMWTLFITGALFDDLTTVLHKFRAESSFLCFCFVVYMVLAAFVTLNMLIGILCEVIRAVAVAEKEKLLVDFVKARLLRVLKDHDRENNMMIAKQSWAGLLKDQRLLKCLEDLGIQDAHMACLGETLFDEEVAEEQDNADSPGSPYGPKMSRTAVNSISWMQFMETLLQMRPDYHASVVHIMELRKFARIKVANVERRQGHLQEQLSLILEVMHQLLAEKQVAATTGGPRPRPPDERRKLVPESSPDKKKGSPKKK